MSNVSKLADAINREQQALRTVVDELKSEETYRLAESIRALSEMVNTGECCEDIADAAVQCAVSFLPGANVMAISIDKAQATARILARANCPFTEVGQALPLAADGLLCAVVDEPKRVHRQRCGVDSNIFPERIDFTDDPNDIFVCKAVPRPGAECFALAMLTDEDSLDRASKVLVTLSELLTALCNARGAIEQQNNSARDIVRAKKEWERTVDVLPEIVCLVDADGKVVRSNRTIERWGLGDVTKVAGKDVHELSWGVRGQRHRVNDPRWHSGPHDTRSYAADTRPGSSGGESSAVRRHCHNGHQ